MISPHVSQAFEAYHRGEITWAQYQQVRKCGPTAAHLPGKTAVVTTFYNPNGWQRRIDNYHQFAERITQQGAELFTIEAAEGEGRFQIPLTPNVHRVIADGTLWQKERLINILVNRLPEDYDKIAFLDADALFENSQWLKQTEEKLKHVAMLQLYEQIDWLDRDGQIVPELAYKSFCAHHCSGGPKNLRMYAPGFAWAARRELWTRYGGLYDRMILGSGDAVLAYAAIGDFAMKGHVALTNTGLADDARQWMRRILEWTGGHVDYVPGRVLHLWHGDKADRRYRERYFRLISLGFDPRKHLDPDETQPLRWAANVPPALPETMRDYFVGRNEDGTHAGPLISALMVTGRDPERKAYAQMALVSLQAQSVTDWELVVINDSDTPYFADCDDPRVREILVEPGMTLGDLRNTSIAFARGEWIIQWDDDDFPGPTRLALQLEHAAEDKAVILQNEIVCDLASGEAYVVSAAHWHANGFPGTILCQRRSPKLYPAMPRGEDTEYLKQFRNTTSIDNDPLEYLRFHVPSSTSGEGHIMGNARRTGRPLTDLERGYVDHVRRLYQQGKPNAVSAPKKHSGRYRWLYADPPILAMAGTLDFLECIDAALPDIVVYKLRWNDWFRTPEQIIEQDRQSRKRRPQDTLIHLVNEYEDYRKLVYAGVHAIYCNQNAVLDEETFRPLNLDYDRAYPAIYNARMNSIKRHGLARGIDGSVCFLGGLDWHSDRSDYFEEVRQRFPTAHFARPAGSPKLSPEQVNQWYAQADVGLCLSHTEGAMFASTEYLLAGLPVVSTYNAGGRNEFFDMEFCRLVPADEQAIADAVQELRKLRIPRDLIRRRTLQKLRQHRQRLIDGLQAIFDAKNKGVDAGRFFYRAFANKYHYGKWCPEADAAQMTACEMDAGLRDIG